MNYYPLTLEQLLELLQVDATEHLCSACYAIILPPLSMALEKLNLFHNTCTYPLLLHHQFVNHKVQNQYRPLTQLFVPPPCAKNGEVHLVCRVLHTNNCLRLRSTVPQAIGSKFIALTLLKR